MAIALSVAVSLGSSCGKGGDAMDRRFLAHDAKTREYLGVVIMECRDWDTQKVAHYKIRLQDGRIIERRPETITIDSP